MESNKNGKAPAFLFFPDAWLSNQHIEIMSGNAVKAYLYLLCRAWQEEPIATLPNDEAVLQRFARVYGDANWAAVKAEILPRFQLNEDGRLFHPKLLFCAETYNRKRIAGMAGWTKTRKRKVIKNLKAKL